MANCTSRKAVEWDWFWLYPVELGNPFGIRASWRSSKATKYQQESLQCADVVQLVERVLPKHQVVGSSPIIRSKFCAVSSVVRVPASHAGGRWFKSSTAHQMYTGEVLVRCDVKSRDGWGTVETNATTYMAAERLSTYVGVIVQLGERFVRNEEVAGSSPAGSTKFWE